MANDGMPRFHFHGLGNNPGADIHTLPASRVELAAIRGIGGRRDAALEDDTVHLG
jgi:hypothetical protein